MDTRVRKVDTDGDYASVISEAAAVLEAGGTVVFPTETVYGVGASAVHREAVGQLRQIKQRGQDKPFTVHIGSRSAVDRFVPELTALGRRLTEKAWPGPLTLIFQVDNVKAAPVIQETSLAHAAAMYHQGTIGIRCPDDRVAMDLLTQARVPVVAASANQAGAPAPVEADEALAALYGQVDLLLDAGRTRYAKPSTIVRVNRQGCQIVRQGVLDERTVRRLIQTNFLLVCTGNTCRSPMGEGFLRRMLADRLGCQEHELSDRDYHIESAGTAAISGAGPSAAAISVMDKRGIDISRHLSQPLTIDQIRRADYILAMTQGHAQTVRSMVPGSGERARMLAEQDIEDPIGGTEEVYERCATQIEDALGRRLEEIPF